MGDMAAVKEKENTSGEKITKHILEQYSDALARIKLLRLSVKNMEYKICQMDKRGYFVTDSVTKGKKGKKSLGTVTIAGFPHNEYRKITNTLNKRREKLLREEQELLELITKVEEYISELEDIEMRNILTLYYVENLTWVQVAHELNAINRSKEYTSDSCRCKHERFLKNIYK